MKSETNFLQVIVLSPIFEYRDNEYIKSDFVNFDLNNTFALCLPRKILIKTGFSYEIQIKQTATQNLYTKAVLKSKFHHGSNIFSEFHQDSVEGYVMYVLINGFIFQ